MSLPLKRASTKKMINLTVQTASGAFPKAAFGPASTSEIRTTRTRVSAKSQNNKHNKSGGGATAQYFDDLRSTN